MDALTRRSKQITEGSILLALLRLAGPVIASIMLQTSYHVINAFWVGRIGAVAVAAVAVTAPLTFFLISLGGGLTVAGSVFVAQYSGARQTDQVNHVAAQTILMVVFTALAFSVIGYLSADAALRFIRITPEVFPDASAYLKISYLGLVFSFGYMIFQSILHGVGEVRYPLYVVAASVIVNAVLDPLLIFGWGGFDGFGVVGAALATVIAQAFAAIVGVSVLFTGRYGIRLRTRDFAPDFVFIRRALALGLPASVEQSTRAFGSVVLIALATGFGTAALAAYGLAIRLITFFLVPTLGMASATATVVGQNIGAGKIERAEQAAKIGAWFGFLSLTALGILFLPFAEHVARLLVPTDETVVDLGAQFVWVVAPAFGIIAAQQVLAGAFRGAGQTMAAMMLSLMLQWCFQLPISYWLSQHTSLGFAGLWWGFPIANAIALIATILWFRRGTWKHKQLTRSARDLAPASE